MTKTMKSRLALLLALALMVCLLAVPAAAEDKAPNAYGIETYVALGDSIATGLNDNTGTNQDAAQQVPQPANDEVLIVRSCHALSSI